ncbi:MAG: response regulator [Spirochaetales bacterium]|nr:response regulator [Spirochaetales bacterium]
MKNKIEINNKKTLTRLSYLFDYFLILNSDLCYVHASSRTLKDFKIDDECFLKKTLDPHLINRVDDKNDFFLIENVEINSKIVNLKFFRPDLFKLRGKGVAYLVVIEDVTESQKLILDSEIDRYFLNSLLELSKLKKIKFDYLLQHAVEHITAFSHADFVSIEIKDKLTQNTFKSFNSTALHFQKDLKSEIDTLFSNIDVSDYLIVNRDQHDQPYSYVYIPINYQDRFEGFCGLVLFENSFDEELAIKILLYLKILIREFDFYRIEAVLEKNDMQFTLIKSICKVATWEKSLSSGNYIFSPEIDELVGLPITNSQAGFDTLLSTIHEEDRDLFLHKLNKTIEKEEDDRLEHRFVLADGMVQWVSQGFHIIETSNGKKLFAIILIITERHDLFEKLLLEKEKNVTILDQLREKNVLIEESSAFLEKATEYFDEKVKNIRSLIDSDIDMKNEDVNRFIDKIQSIILNLKDYFEIRDGEYILKISDVSIDQLFTEIAEVLSPECDESVQLSFEKDLKVPEMIQADYRLLKKILMTLTYNAVKNTSSGLVRVKANLKKFTQEDNSYEIEFSVQDTGVGLATSFSNIINNFADSKKENSEKKLSYLILEKLVHYTGGSLELDSLKDKGSIFYYSNSFKKSEKSCEDLMRFACFFQAVVIDMSNNYLDLISDYLYKFSIKTDSFTNYQKAGSVIKQLEENNIGYDMIFFNAGDPAADLNWFFEFLQANVPDFSSKIIVSLNLNSAKDSTIKEFIDLNLEKPFTQTRLFNSLSKLEKLDAIQKSKKYFEKSFEYQGVKILIVDDDEINQKLTAELLKSVNIQTDFAKNGEAAVELLGKLTEEYYDCILMDLQMPVLGGIETTHIIRNAYNWKKIPIIAMTARSDSGLYSDILNSGINEVINKPIDINIFHNFITRFVDEKKILITSHKIEADIIQPDASGLRVLNLSEALPRLANNKKLLIELLQAFYERNSNFLEEIRDLLTLSNFIKVEEKLHDLKGSSGNLGLDLLHEASKEMEKIIKFSSNDLLKIQFGVDNLSENFVKTFRYISEFLKENSD